MLRPHPVTLCILLAFLSGTFSSSIAQSIQLKNGFDSLKGENIIRAGGDWQIEDNLITVDTSPAKLLFKKKPRKDFELSIEVRAKLGVQAGVIFRVANIGKEIDQYDGYYVGIHAGHESIIWGAAQQNWTEIARRSAATEPDTWHAIRIVAQGSQIRGWIDQVPVNLSAYPTFDGIDERFSSGGVGLRALGGHAEFRNLRISEPPPPMSARTYVNPVQNNIADPTVIKFEGQYYLFCTSSADHPLMEKGIRLFTSTNLTQWEDRGYVLKQDQSWGRSRFWAPDIIQRRGQFFLYYATDTRICVAKADHPAGPFTELPQSPIEPDTVRIDAHVFQDGDKLYFYYVHFNKGNEIWGGELNDDMVSLKRESLRLRIRADQPWERHQAAIAEGPVMLKHQNTYYLTYSGSHFESPNYAVGYATSSSPLGPWKKHRYNPIMKSTAYAHGTAHHCFTVSPDDTENFILYHRHHNLNNTEPRQLAIDRVQFVPQNKGPAMLQIHGPTVSPQRLPSGAR